MGSVLIAMPKAEDANKIATMIRKQGMLMDVRICSTGAEVLRVASDRDYGAIICTKILRDMSYSDLAYMLPDYFGMIVLTSDRMLETPSDKVVKLLLPFKSMDLLNTLEMITQGFYRSLRKKKKAPLKRSTEEQKVIDTAKALLMERNGMSEPEAFRYIQKNSMDSGRSLSDAAQMILVLLNE